MRCVGHVERIGKTGNLCDILFKDLKGSDSWEELNVDDKIILKWITGNGVGGCGVDSSGSG
jgi:hypothetical protein